MSCKWKQKDGLIKLQVDVTAELKARLAFKATMNKCTMGVLVTEALEDYFEKEDKS